MMSLDDTLQEAPENALLLRLEAGSTLGQTASAASSDSARLWLDVKQKGRRVALLETSLAEVGYRTDRVVADDEFRLPLYIGRALSALFRAESEIVWLVLTEPRGSLPSVPWEALFAPWIVSPLVRYSTNNVCAERLEQTRDSVVCFCCGADDTMADRRAVVELYLGMLPEQLGDSTIHVFADETTRTLLDDTRPQFLIYEPPIQWDAPDSTRGDINHPWLVWVRDAMRGKTVNFVHIVCDGTLGDQEGGLAFISPISSTDNRIGYPVGARELNTFLDRLGTWSIGFSSPPTNQSVAGLRYLHDQLGEERAGPVLLHDMARDFDGTALLAGYYFYLSGGAPVHSAATSLYWNPARSRFKPAQKRKLSDSTPLTRLKLTNSNAATPSWVLTAQRTIEASLSALRYSADSKEEAEIQQGIAAALQSASKAIAESAQMSQGRTAYNVEERTDARE